MEPYDLAIEALRKVDTTSHRGNLAGQAASSRSSPNAPGIDIGPPMANNRSDGDAAGSHELSQPLLGTQGCISRSGAGQDLQSNTVRGLQTASSNNSQSTMDGHDVVSSPPTSTSDGSSSQNTNPDRQLSQLSQLSQLAAAQEPLGQTSSTRPNLSVASTAGYKRTADGQVKPLSATSPESPHFGGHSRNSSSVSNVSSATSSRIGGVRPPSSSRSSRADNHQLSSELKTRLTYAMVKVNNGWQSNTIEEIESLASQAGSPTSSTSTLQGRRNLLTSPRTAIANIQSHNSVTYNQRPAADFDLYSREQPSRTYESFWRDHSTTTYPTHRHVQAPATSPPLSKALAPPADIHPTPSSRRSSTPKFTKPPTIPTHGSNSPYQNSAPRTPHRTDFRENIVIQTPTQKTIQEQDAIETLLFMSSPGNSGNMGHAFPPPRTQGSPQQSPLRTEFNVLPKGAQGRRVEFERAATSGSGGSSEAGVAEYRSKMKGKSAVTDRVRREAIDRLLDETGESSSDDEEIILNHRSPGKVAAGRV